MVGCGALSFHLYAAYVYNIPVWFPCFDYSTGQRFFAWNFLSMNSFNNEQILKGCQVSIYWLKLYESCVVSLL